MEGEAAVREERQWAEEAYQAMAPVYDEFTAHHDYELWLGNLFPHLRRHGLSGNRLLDVGCGTGKSFLPMLARDWQVTARDLSPAMVELARAKAGEGVDLGVADMRELPRLGEFDLVWSLDDAVNYLLDREELRAAVSGMAANLAPHGLLLFDVNTLHSYRTFFAEEERVRRGEHMMIWRGRTSREAPPEVIAEAHFEVTAGPERERVEAHLHRQRHFPEAEVLGVLEECGLECLDVFGHGHDAVPQQPLEDLRHTKAVYIARRARAASTKLVA